MGLFSFGAGRNRGLSDEAERGRRELVWISGAIWIAPLVAALTDIGSGGVDVPASSIVLNLAVIAGLGEGRSWARRLTLGLTTVGAVVQLAFIVAVSVGEADATRGELLTAAANALVYGVGAWMLWRSPDVQAYFESQRAGFNFPVRERQPGVPAREPLATGAGSAGQASAPGALPPAPVRTAATSPSRASRMESLRPLPEGARGANREEPYKP